MVVSISDPIKKEIEASGVYWWRRAFAEAQVDALRGEIEVLRARLGGDGPDANRLVYVHEASSGSLDLLLAPRLTHLLAEVLEDTPVLFHASSFKYGSNYPAHTDRYFYWSKDPADELSVWVALEDVERDSGPFFYYPGSHHWNLISHRRFKERYPDWFRQAGEAVATGRWPELRRQLLSEVLEYYVLEIERHIQSMGQAPVIADLKKGDVLIWRSAVIHGAKPRMDQQRTRHCFTGVYLAKRAQVGTIDQFFLPELFPLNEATARHPEFHRHGQSEYVIDGKAAFS